MARCTLILMFLVLLLTQYSMAKVPIDEFFSFGVSNGDTVMVTGGDGSSPKLNLSIAFPFFDYLHDALWVNVNGDITFLRALSTYTPVCSAVSNDLRMIAPFWSDVHYGDANNIFYRESFDPLLLEKANREVVAAFPEFSNIRLKWVYIVTWFNVTFYGAGSCGIPRNTFQVAITTDGVYSFVVLYYNDITWTTGTANGGNCSGLGGSPAKAGFDAGDGRALFTIPGSCTDDMVTIDDRSNVGSPGKWLFRVDNSNIQSAGCSSNFTGNFRVSPTFVDTFGHQTIEISGPCVEPYENATCQFYDPNGNVTEVPAAVMGNQTSMKLLCDTPFFYSTGRLNMDVIVTSSNATQKRFTGYLYVIMPLDNDNGFNVDIQQSPNETDSFILTFTWNPNTRKSLQLDSTCEDYVDIAIYSMEKSKKIWEVVQLVKKGVNNGKIALHFLKDKLKQLTGCGTLLDAAVMATFGAVQHICDMAVSSDYRQHAAFYGYKAMAKFFGDQCGQAARAAMCVAWYATDPQPPPGLPPCPPTTALANADNRFDRDEGCISTPPPCFYHPGVDFCIRSVGSVSAGLGSQQCCYKGDRIQLGPPAIIFRCKNLPFAQWTC